MELPPEADEAGGAGWGWLLLSGKEVVRLALCVRLLCRPGKFF